MRLFLSLCAVPGLFLSAEAGATTIDDFEAGPFSFGLSAPGVDGATQTGLAPGHVIGDARSVTVSFGGSGPGSVDADLVTTGGDDAAQLTIDGTSLTGALRLQYGDTDNVISAPFAPLHADLTLGGDDRFLIHLSEAPSGGSIRLRVKDGAATCNTGIFCPAPLVVSGPGTYAIPYADFKSTLGFVPISFTDIDGIDLELFGPSGSGPRSWTVSDFRTGVPEPGTGLLLWSGLLGLCLRARHRESVPQGSAK